MPTEQTSPLSPMQTGLRGRCPRCGEGHLFEGFLKIRAKCEVCGLDYSFADPADGPAFFVIMFTCIPAVAFALWLEIVYQPPFWVHLLTPQGIRQLVPYQQRRLRPLGQPSQHTGQRFPSRRQLQLWRPRSLDRGQPLLPSAGRAAVSRLRRTRCRIPIRAAQRRQDPDGRPIRGNAVALGVLTSLGAQNAAE